MNKALGEKQWIIPDGYIPPGSTGTLISHEAVCILNSSSEDATIHFTIFFEDREPISDIVMVVPARRTKHIKTNLLQKDGLSIPSGVPYAIEVQSDIPIIVQYSRLDTTQAANALMTTMAYAIKAGDK